jgi:hypothetical protein
VDELHHRRDQRHARAQPMAARVFPGGRFRQARNTAERGAPALSAVVGRH